jgi:PAS domain S-box-containing protein
VATILVVDDRPSNRQFLTTLLGYGGHRMLEAADGAQALEVVRAQRPDLVITDILMPTMDGYEFVQQVRADPDVAPTPVIFYTATYSTPQAEALAKNCGVATVLSKPCEPQVILAAVNKALRIRDPGAGEPPALAGGRAVPRAQSADDTLTLYMQDLQEVQHKFEDLVKSSGKVRAERDSIKDLSQKFAENVAAMQRITTRLSALFEVGMEMMRERDPERLVELFFAAICDIVDSKYAAIGMLDENEQVVRYVFARGLDIELFRGEAGRTGLLGTILGGERVLRARGANGTRSAQGLPTGHPPVRDLLAIPVASAERTYGWMYFADKRGEEGFTEEDTRLAKAMTTRLALLYENAVLYDQIQRHAAELQIEVGERRRTEKALAESEGGLRRAQTMARLAHVITGPDGSFQSWSETLPQLAGVEAAKMPRSTRAWLKLLHPGDQPLFRGMAIEAATERKRRDVEYRLKRAGGWIHVRQTMEPLDGEGEAGGRMRWFNTLQDITGQKQAEEAIRLAELNYRSIFENTVEGIYRVDEDGKAVAANPALVRILGYTSHEEMTAAVTNIAYQVYADPEARKAYRKLLRDKGIVSGFETQWLRKDGSRV